MSDKDREALLPCPFCSGVAMGPYSLKETSYGRVGQIYCANVKCRAEVEFQAERSKGEHSDYAEKKAIERWNNRPDHYAPKLTEAEAATIIKRSMADSRNMHAMQLQAEYVMKALRAAGVRFKDEP